MKPRFEVDQVGIVNASQKGTSGQSVHRAPDGSQSFDVHPTQRRYVESESHDAHERNLAIDVKRSTCDWPRFVVEKEKSHGDVVSDELHDNHEETSSPVKQACNVDNRTGAESSGLGKSLELSEPRLQSQTTTECSWRQEVTASLNKYQTRRRLREPRYPSLQLKFETQEGWRASHAIDSTSQSSSNSLVRCETEAAIAPAPHKSVQSSSSGDFEPARVIEFPRYSSDFSSHPEELAEPVFDRPRIMEAPAVVTDTPAGILIETVESQANERRPGFEMPLQAAHLGRRLAATLVDAIIVSVGLALFAYVGWRISNFIPAVRLAVTIGIVAVLTLWTGYQYLLIVYCGATPGLKLAKLRLNRFDGSSVPRKMRRWRVLASILSAASLGLGYAWCFLDEDQLCWHDRITRTYIAPTAQL